MISILAAFFSYSFVDLAACEPNSNGAKAFYGIWLCAIYAVFPGVYATMAPGILSTFGPKFYSSNYGLVYTQNVRSSPYYVACNVFYFQCDAFFHDSWHLVF